MASITSRSAVFLLFGILVNCTLLFASVASAPQSSKQNKKDTASTADNTTNGKNKDAKPSSLDDKLPKPVIPTRNGCDCARIFYPDKYTKDPHESVYLDSEKYHWEQKEKLPVENLEFL
jgi:hypothetical protein